MEKKVVGVIILSIVVLGFIAYILIGELMPKAKVKEREEKPTPTPTPTPTIPPKPILPTSAVVDDFNVSVAEAKWAESLDSYNSSYEDGRFLLVSLSVENTGKSERLFGVIGEYFGATGSAEIVVIDGEGYEYPSFGKVPLPDSEIRWTVLPQMVSPNMTKEWIIAFDLPPESHDLQLGLRASKADEWTMLKLVME